MKSDQQLAAMIVAELLCREDIAYIRELITAGFSDQEIQARLSIRMAENAESLRAYIAGEKEALVGFKIASRAHWLVMLFLVRQWMEGKEGIVGWQEADHDSDLAESANRLKEEAAKELKLMTRDPGNEMALSKIMSILEREAKKIVVQAETRAAFRHRPVNRAKGMTALGQAKQALLDEWITEEEIMRALEERGIFEIYLGMNGTSPHTFIKAYPIMTAALNRGQIDGLVVAEALRPLEVLKRKRRMEYTKKRKT